MKPEDTPKEIELISPDLPAAIEQYSEEPRPGFLPFIRIILWLTGVGLSVLPPLLVVMERWFELPVRDILRPIWCRVPLLCKSVLPSYFLWIIPAFGFFILFFSIAVKSPASIFTSVSESTNRQTRTPSGTWQRWSAVFAAILAVLTGMFSLFLAWRSERLPGIELILAILVFLIACWLLETHLDQALIKFKRIAPKLFIMGLGQVILIFFLRSAAEGTPFMWLAAAMLGVITFILLRYIKTPPIYWVVSISLALMCYRIGYWQFSVIGDEYAFFSYAVQHVNNDSLLQIISNVFQGSAVYESHPFLSSVMQMASMALLGEDNFGWRFSSIYLAAISLFFFYGFFTSFLSKRTTLFCVMILGASQYLMTFGKIGYNNLQALFAVGLVLWAAANAYNTHRKAAYAGLGAAMGICFYLYPVAIYATPLAWLFLLVAKPPVNRRSIGFWGMTFAGMAFFLIPLIFQPEYWVAKIPGTFLQQSEIVKNTPLLEHIGMNCLYTLFSFLYAPAETHFVVSSYIDPLSAALLPAGLAITLGKMRRNRFSLFWILGFIYILFAVGATHDRQTPSTTRMFMILPWFCSFAGIGLAWFINEINSSFKRTHQRKTIFSSVIIVMIIAGIVATNGFMAYSLSRQRTTGVPSLEVLFLRLLQREQNIYPDSKLSYLFITDPDWGIDGIRVQRDVYNLPRSQDQLERIAVEEPAIPLESISLIANEDTLVILQPWMNEDMKLSIEEQLMILEKFRCDVRDTPEKDTRYTLWLSEKWNDICPWDGNWSLPKR